MTGYGGASAVADGGGGVHLVLPLDTRDIYYLAWTGERWLAAENVSTDPVRRSYWPRLAIAGGNRLHLVWNQGHPEIALPDLEDRLAQGEYEILHKEILLDAPRVQPADCRIGSKARATPSPVPQEGAATPVATLAATAAATATPAALALSPPAALPPGRATMPILAGLAAAALVVSAIVLGRSLGRS
jgi:hypothetical protein